jgi:hypothetical protein
MFHTIQPKPFELTRLSVYTDSLTLPPIGGKRLAMASRIARFGAGGAGGGPALVSPAGECASFSPARFAGKIALPHSVDDVGGGGNCKWL